MIALFIAPVVRRRLQRPRPARGRGRRAHLRGCPRALAGDGADRRRRPDLRPHAGVVTVFTGLVMDLGEVARGRADRATACGCPCARALTAEVSPGDSVAINGVCLTATTVDDGALHRRRDERDAATARRWAPPARARGSTSSCRCGRRTGSAATSCRATSTAPAGDRGDRGRRLRPPRARRARGPGAAALRRREGVDRDRRRVADRRLARRRRASRSR